MSDEPVAATIVHKPAEEIITLPELPEKPTGWTKHMLFHLNFGGRQGAATYEIRDENKRLMNIGYSYNTKAETAGFFIRDIETPLMSWTELRRRYVELTTPAGTATEPKR